MSAAVCPGCGTPINGIFACWDCWREMPDELGDAMRTARDGAEFAAAVAAVRGYFAGTDPLRSEMAP